MSRISWATHESALVAWQVAQRWSGGCSGPMIVVRTEEVATNRLLNSLREGAGETDPLRRNGNFAPARTLLLILLKANDWCLRDPLPTPYRSRQRRRLPSYRRNRRS